MTRLPLLPCAGAALALLGWPAQSQTFDTVTIVAASPLPGLYEVKLKGSRVLYASADGQYIVQGYMFQLKDGKPVNLTEKTERLGISKLIQWNTKTNTRCLRIEGIAIGTSNGIGGLVQSESST